MSLTWGGDLKELTRDHVEQIAANNNLQMRQRIHSVVLAKLDVLAVHYLSPERFSVGEISGYQPVGSTSCLNGWRLENASFPDAIIISVRVCWFEITISRSLFDHGLTRENVIQWAEELCHHPDVLLNAHIQIRDAKETDEFREYSITGISPGESWWKLFWTWAINQRLQFIDQQ